MSVLYPHVELTWLLVSVTTPTLGKAKNIILEIINGDERVLGEPPPVVAVSELADSSVKSDFQALGEISGLLADTLGTDQIYQGKT